MEWSGSISRSPGKAASAHAGTGSSSRRRQQFAGMDSSGRPPGSVLAQRLCGSPLPLIQCDDCTRTVLRLTSGTPNHPRRVLFKCENDGVRALAISHCLVQLRILIPNMVILFV
ncbi:Catalase isozyme 2 [Hordeum vulgare]|nr:Catalase isozyme 2 [Hordeum vulgare]